MAVLMGTRGIHALERTLSLTRCVCAVDIISICASSTREIDHANYAKA